MDIDGAAEKVGKKAYEFYKVLTNKQRIESDEPTLDELLKGKGQAGRVRIYQAIQPDGTALWPDQRPIEWLARERNNMVEANFNAQYQNDPSGLTGVLLDVGWLNFYDENDIPNLENFIGYQGADPATSQRERANYFGHCTSARDPETGQIYVLGFVYDKIPATEHEEFMQVQYIHWLMRDLRILEVSYETQGPNQGAAQLLMESNRKNDLIPMPLVASPPKGKKEDRILSLRPHFKSTILFPGHLNVNGEWEMKKDAGFEEFLKEYMSFPLGGRDDLLDALFLSVDPLMEITSAAAVMRRAAQTPQPRPTRSNPNYGPEIAFEDDQVEEKRRNSFQRRRDMLNSGRLGSGVMGGLRSPLNGLGIASFQTKRPQAVRQMSECSCVQDDRCQNRCNCFRGCACNMDCRCKLPRYLDDPEDPTR